MQTVFLQDLGIMSYQTAWDFQTRLHRDLVDNKLKNRDLSPKLLHQNHQLLLVEHPPVFTLGRSGAIENLLLTETELAEKGIEFFPINRGGDITFHGPGQLVGYPILDLDLFFNDVHLYVRKIEEVIIRTLADFGIEGFRIEKYTGVWVGNTEKLRKICAIGVHLSRWVTLHGWALNVATDLKYFDFIVPCGIAEDDKTVTSMEVELGKPVDFQEVKSKIAIHFAAVFECQVHRSSFIVHSSC